MKQGKKTHQLHVLLNDNELEIFKKKARNYSKMSTMVRDAVVQFNDNAAHLQLDALNELSELIKSFSLELSKQGGNLNQVVKRANELIYSGELNKDYFEEMILPSVNETRKIISEIKKQQIEIFKKVKKL